MGRVSQPPHMPQPPARRRRWGVIILIALAVIAVMGAGGWWAYGNRNPPEISGNSTEEFVPPTTTSTTEPVTTTSAAPPPQSWPTYGFDNARTRWNPLLKHRPPFTKEWVFGSGGLLEFPPSVADGKLFVGQLRGKFFAVDTATGKVLWRKSTGHCSAASPTIANGIVYASFLAKYPCPKGEPGEGGFVFAWNADTGEQLWAVALPPVESSPLVVNGTVYVGAWDKKVYAFDALTGATKWTTETDAQIVSSASWVEAASTGGTPAIVIGTNGGSLYKLDAETGKVLWQAQSLERLGSGREYFYATPTVAYGRIYIGNTDGWMYAYGAETGKLLWAKAAGTYVYTAAVAADGVIYIGTYDGRIIAFDAATGARNWTLEVPGAVHGAPTLMDGLLYFSTCSGCGKNGVRDVKSGPDGQYAIDITTREIVWTFPDGKYSPLVADDERVYLTGVGVVHGMKPAG